MSNNFQITKSHSFTIPSEGNEITTNDIKNKQIRITAAFKGLFPYQDDELKVTIKNTHTLVFKYRGKRSHILRLGIEPLEELGIKAGDKLKVTKLGLKKFRMEVLK